MTGKQSVSPDLGELIKSLESDSLPPVHLWDPDFCGNMDLVIKRDGSWWYQNSPIGRKRLVKLFSTVLKREGDEFFLVTPVEKLGITVEDAPFLAIRFEQKQLNGKAVLIFEDNCDNKMVLSREHPLWVIEDPVTGEPSPYLRVRNNLDALIHRPIFYQLIELAQQRQEGDELVLEIESAGQVFELGRIQQSESDNEN